MQTILNLYEPSSRKTYKTFMLEVYEAEKISLKHCKKIPYRKLKNGCILVGKKGIEKYLTTCGAVRKLLPLPFVFGPNYEGFQTDGRMNLYFELGSRTKI